MTCKSLSQRAKNGFHSLRPASLPSGELTPLEGREVKVIDLVFVKVVVRFKMEGPSLEIGTVIPWHRIEANTMKRVTGA